MDWRWWVGGTGRVLITIGVLMFGFVAYQLWGTAIETARAQRSLGSDFDEMLAGVEPVDPGADVAIDGTVTEDDATAAAGSTTNIERDGEATSDDSDKKKNKKKNKKKQNDDNVATEAVEEEPEPDAPAAVPVADQNIPDIHDGDALARLEIPRIGVDHIVVAGVSTGDLKKGPGHYPDTPLPGQLGNSAIAGHRTTYGQPFYSVEQLEAGDEITVTTLSGRFVYRVTGQEIVGPSDYEVVATVDPTLAKLTLTSCHPRWTAQQRIVVYSELVDEDSAPVGEPLLNYGRPAAEDAAEESASEVAAGDDPAPTGVESGSDSSSERPARDDPALQSGDEPSEGDPTPAEADAADETTGAADETTGAADETTGAASTGSDPVDEANNAAIADAFSEGWFSDPGAPLHVALWGLLLAAIGSIAYLLSRAARRYWVGGLAFVLPFLLALYFFYQNVNRLLPPNL